MKKILSIALVAALVLTSAFAATTKGSATISAVVDMDNADYGLKNAQTTEISWSQEFESGEVGSKGEGNLYAEIAGKFSVKATAAKATGAMSATSQATSIDAKLELTKANIIYKEITFGILNAGKGNDYAVSFRKNTDGTPVRDKITAMTTTAGGFTVTAYGYDGGFALAGNWEAETNETFAHVQTKSFEIADGVTAQAAAAVKYLKAAGADGKFSAVANAKAAYATDKMSADVAADVAIADKATVEVAANAKYAPVTVNVYAYVAEDTILDAKVAGDLKVEDIAINAYAQIVDALADAREIEVGASAKEAKWNAGLTVTMVPATEAYKVKATCGYDEVSADATVEIASGDLKTIAANVKHANADFTAKAGVTVGFAADEVSSIKPTYSIESGKVINNAVVSLTWNGADFKAEKKGTVTAAAKVSF